MSYRYEIDDTRDGDLHLRCTTYEVLQDAYRGLRDEWNRRALDHGGSVPPYEQEVDDLNRMLAWGDEQLTHAGTTEITIMRDLDRELVNGTWPASPAQVYLDLMRGEGRAGEMAKHLRHERLGFRFGSRRESFNLSAKILFCIEGGHRRSGNVGESGEIEPWDLLLVREHDDGLERQTVKQEVRQHDGRQSCLVAARDAVEEHGSPVAAGKVVVDRIVVAVWNVGRNVVGIDIVLVQHREQQASQVVVERGRHPLTAPECQVMNFG